MLGGILAAGVFALWTYFRRLAWRWQFKQIFGSQIEKQRPTLVYEELELRDKSQNYPYVKPGGNPVVGLSIRRPIPIASVRSINYLAATFGKFAASIPDVRSDLEVCNKMDFDFVSFGGPFSNDMTVSTYANPSNNLAVFDQGTGRFLSKDGLENLSPFETGFDYGLILKIHPRQFPDRVWLSCAGLGERGTSGASWFLANKWQEIRQNVGSQPFAAVVQVEGDTLSGRDQSAVLKSLVFFDRGKAQLLKFA